MRFPSIILIIIYSTEYSKIATTPNYEYLKPITNENCEILQELTPKEYVETISPGQHMISINIPDGYYSSAFGLTGNELKDEIEVIITNNYEEFSYTKVYDFVKIADLNPKNSSEI